MEQSKARTVNRSPRLLQQENGPFYLKLKDLKASNPVEVAKHAVANRLVEEPAFKWWVPHVLQRRNMIISKVKSRYWQTTDKFGIHLPKTVVEALEIDKATDTDFCGETRLSTRKWPKSRWRGKPTMA
jgi:hypothetical protein